MFKIFILLTILILLIIIFKNNNIIEGAKNTRPPPVPPRLKELERQIVVMQMNVQRVHLINSKSEQILMTVKRMNMILG